MKLTNIFKGGLWPYTPDPEPPGLYTFGAPRVDAPVIISGNSRHAIGRLQNALASIGARVLAVDNGGIDLSSASRQTLLTLEQIRTTLAGVETCESEISKRALVPYPIWTALGLEENIALDGWQLLPGPANDYNLPGFFAGGSELTEEMKTPHMLLGERLQLALAHAGLFTLVATFPMLMFGFEVWLVGTGTFLIDATAITALWPWIPGKKDAYKGLVFNGLILLLGLTPFLLGPALLSGSFPVYVLVILSVLGIWIAFLCSANLWNIR